MSSDIKPLNADITSQANVAPLPAREKVDPTDRLPLEMSTYMFNFLTERKDQNEASLVSHKWHSILHNYFTSAESIFRRTLSKQKFYDKLCVGSDIRTFKLCALIHNKLAEALGISDLQKVNYSMTESDVIDIYSKHLSIIKEKTDATKDEKLRKAFRGFLQMQCYNLNHHYNGDQAKEKFDNYGYAIGNAFRNSPSLSESLLSFCL